MEIIAVSIPEGGEKILHGIKKFTVSKFIGEHPQPYTYIQ